MNPNQIIDRFTKLWNACPRLMAALCKPVGWLLVKFGKWFGRDV